jgi:type IV pilus assembly protein PilA
MGSNPYPATEPPKKKKTALIIGIVLGCGCLSVILVGIIAAIAIPSLLRARVSANESQSIGDIRSVISAEMAYQSANAGRFGTLECLQAPSSCIPGYSGSNFLSPDTSQPERAGYRRTLELSPDGDTFTYIAVPIEAGRTGVRAFCGDSSGVICQTDGSQPSTSGGQCEINSTCTPL